MGAMLEKLKAMLEGPEGDEIIKRTHLKWDKEDKHEKLNYERTVRLIKNNGLDNFMNKCVEWYESGTYVKRERSLGYEPRRVLLSYICEYFEKNGVETDEGTNMFMECNYEINGWLVGMMHGQGSVVKRKFEQASKSLGGQESRVVLVTNNRSTIASHRIPITTINCGFDWEQGDIIISVDEKFYSKEATKLAIVHDFIYQIEPDIWEKIRNSKTDKECKTHLGEMLKRQI